MLQVPKIVIEVPLDIPLYHEKLRYVLFYLPVGDNHYGMSLLIYVTYSIVVVWEQRSE